MYSPEAAMEICSLLRFLVIWVSNCKTKMFGSNFAASLTLLY